MQASQTSNEPIAIIGMGCRYPQAESLHALWELLLGGRDAIAPYPGGRFAELDRAYAETAEGKQTLATHMGGFLPHVDTFDASFFGISPREAAFIDPQQRLLLEVSWNALEDAGQTRERYHGSRTGVFTGLWTTDYENHIFRNSEKPEFYLLTGGGRSTACGRISFTFGFEGPSISVDTACSSSMVAIHLACQSLRQRECDMALAGGVNIILSTDFTRLFTHAGMLSPEGRCKFGDQHANGFVRSEGAGMIVVKRLSDALSAGDGIYAVIRGSAVNNDGKSSGLLVTPSRSGQKGMLLEAWRQAGISGSDLSYIEAHGTGTHVGDPVEIGAIADALQAEGTSENILIGSMKSNIGHTESAAGVAGVIKTALILHHGIIPASLHQQLPNEQIDWQANPVEMVRSNRLLRRDAGKVCLAGASSFGLTGTNAHMVLAQNDSEVHLVAPSPPDHGDSTAFYLLPITAYTHQALMKNAGAWQSFLRGGGADQAVGEMSLLAGERRTHLRYRFAALGSTTAELAEQVDAMLAGESSISPQPSMASSHQLRVAFVCPGQGSQWAGMAHDLLRENQVFRASFAACDAAIQEETGWSLMERLEGSHAARFLNEIDFVQPALFAMSVALAAVWRASGVLADVVIGHSMGEVAAAHLAGCLSLNDAASVICRRSRLMRTISGAGAMASIELPAGEVERWIEQFNGRVSIAAENSVQTTVVAGEAEAIDQLLEWLELKEIFCRRIKVDVASHSAQVDSILGLLADQLLALQPQHGELRFYSTVRNAFVDGASLNADYWVENLRQPVRLAAATAALADSGIDCFVELSPHPILVAALEDTLRVAAKTLNRVDGQSGLPMALPSLSRGNPAWPALLHSMGRYWSLGGTLNWSALTAHGTTAMNRRVRLPDYEFERERFWPEPSVAAAVPVAAMSNLSPFLLQRTDPAVDTDVTIFTVNADCAVLPYLKDHRVGGSIVFPASAHLETVLEAAHLLDPTRRPVLEDVTFMQALYLSEATVEPLQLVLRRIVGRPGEYGFSLMGNQGTAQSGWTSLSKGRLILSEKHGEVEETSPVVQLGGIPSGNTLSGSASEHYAKAIRSGLHYGPAFQLVSSFEINHPQARTRLHTAPEHLDDRYQLHPAILDSCFQAMLHLRPARRGETSDEIYLPVHIRRLEVMKRPSQVCLAGEDSLSTEANFLGFDVKAGTLDMELKLRSASGELVARVDAMTVQRIKSRGLDTRLPDLYVMGWKPMRELPAPSPHGSAGKHWLIFADGTKEGCSASYAALLAKRHGQFAGRCTLVWPGTRFRALEAGERWLDLLGADEYELPLQDTRALDTLLALVHAEAGRICDIFDFWTLPSSAAPTGIAEVMGSQLAGSYFVPTLIQAVARANWANPPRLWLTSEATQDIPGSPTGETLGGATIWGLGRTLTREHPEFQTMLVDFGIRSGGAAPSMDEIESLIRLALDATGRQARPETMENQVALRGGRCWSARVAPCRLPAFEEAARPVKKQEAWCLVTGSVGSLDTLHLRIKEEIPAAPGEVRIEIEAAGLNFIDVTKALGIYPGLDPQAEVHMGGECSGRIVTVGSGVTDFEVGQKVIALTPSPTRVGMLASHVNVPAKLVLARPSELTAVEAATLPIAYLTAHYSLNELARLQPGEWVLIHSGAGGVGLAAAQIALSKGARVIATASSSEKYDFLRAWGVAHVLPSRSLEFADGVLALTEGRGVDVVLNSLSGDFLVKSLDMLAPYGRFVELGKRDIYDDRRVGLKVFRQNIAYFAVDLASLIEDKPAYAASMLDFVMKAVREGQWKPLPVGVFGAHAAVEAFQFMAQGRHIGKLALQCSGLEGLHAFPVRGGEQASLFHRDATYVVTGGLGGVGAAVAEWMAREGAGNIVLVSRREAGASEREVLHRVREAGARVEHYRTDLLDSAAVEALMRRIADEMPPLRGVFHAAAVIDDALMQNMRPERFEAVFAPKIGGTWNLHQATKHVLLDYFVMFSSFASIFPQPGHGSYAAANSFMDAFAGYRRSLGLAACSINWAGWLGLGLAREVGTSRTIEAYEAEGFGSFEREDALTLLGNVLRSNATQVLAVNIRPDTLKASHGTIPPIFREVAGRDEGSATEESSMQSSEYPLLDELQSLPSRADRTSRLEAALREEVGRVLKLSAHRVTSHEAFGQMGIDSLMALEFIRRVNAALGLALPATAVFNYPTVAILGLHIAKRLGWEADDAERIGVAQGDVDKTRASGGSPRGQSLRQVLEDVSEEEALKALLESHAQPGDPFDGA